MTDRRGLVTLGAASLVSPAGFLAANATRSPSLGRIAVAVGGLFLLGVLFLGLFRLVGSQEKSEAVEAAVAIVAWSYFGFLPPSLVDASGWSFLLLGTLSALACGLVVVWLAPRYTVLPTVLRAAIAAAVILPLLSMLGQPLTARAAEVQQDVVVLFVDAYASANTLASFGFDNSGFYDQLERREFSVEPDASASYSMTYVSIASTLEMEYPVAHGATINGTFRQEMYQKMGGDNHFVRVLRDRGYQYVHIESGWSGTRCGAQVDRCFPASVLDETMWNMIQRTAAARLSEQLLGHFLIVGGLNTVAELLSLELNDSVPELVIGHLLLPHPPMFLDSGCAFRNSDLTRGLNLWAPYLGGGQTRELRLSAYTQQLACTNELLVRVADDDTFADAIVVFVGDHGPDSLAQLVTPVAHWSNEQIEERMRTLLAIRGCDPPVPGLTVDALAFVLSCVGVTDSKGSAYRSFLVPVEEVHPRDTVVELSLMEAEIP